MEDKQKNQIANELFFAGKCFLIGLIVMFILCAIINNSIEWCFKYFDQILLIALIFVGVGYAIRLIKWVFKWKS